MTPPKQRGGEQGGSRVLFEMHQIGQSMRIAAIDERTGVEVVAIAPATASPTQMKNLALAKLERALERRDRD
jgi:Domain of unknown function (DUF6898)